MPIYEYRCKSCGSVTEVLQKMSDKPLKQCTKCKGSLEKLISRTSFQLKGTGWYATGYASKGKRDKSADEAKSADSSAGSKSESGSGDSSADSSGSKSASSTETKKKRAGGGSTSKD